MTANVAPAKSLSDFVGEQPFPMSTFQPRINSGLKRFRIISTLVGHMLFWLRRFFSNAAYHKQAFEEVLIVSVVSIFPLLLLPFIAGLKAAAELPLEFGPTLWKAIASGQLYLYSFSLFGAIIWLCSEDVYDGVFPPRKYFVVASVLAAFLCLLVYALDPELGKPLNPVLVYVSIVIYVIYLIMYYALLVFKMLRAPELGETLDRNASQLIKQSSRSRRAS